MSRYEVVGQWRYLDNAPGSEFEADLPAPMEALAIDRGAIRILDNAPVTLQPGSVRLADGWQLHAQEG